MKFQNLTWQVTKSNHLVLGKNTKFSLYQHIIYD